MPNLSDLFSAGGFLKWDGAGNTDADYTSQAASDLAADAAFTAAFPSAAIGYHLLTDYGTVDTTGVSGAAGNAAALAAAHAAIYAAGGGTLVWPAGDILIDTQIVLPDDGGNIFTSDAQIGVPIVWRGQGSWAAGQSDSSLGAGGTRLILTYDGATYNDAKIVTRGLGSFTIEDITLADTTALADTPFLYTTNTTLRLHRVAFIGATSGESCAQDAVVCGGTTKPISTGYDDADSAFQGYGTVITGCYFERIRRAVYGRSYYNQVQFTGNMMDKGCGTNLAGGALVEIDGSLDPLTANEGDYCKSNVVNGNYFHYVGGYAYGVKIVKGAYNTVAFNGFEDPGDNMVAGVRFEGVTVGATDYPSLGNLVIGNYDYQGNHISEDTLSSGQNFVLGVGEDTYLGSILRLTGSAKIKIDTPESGVANFAITDGTTEFLQLDFAQDGSWTMAGPLVVSGNAVDGVADGTTSITIGNNSQDASAVLALKAPDGKQNRFDYYRVGVNAWSLYDANSPYLFLRDQVNGVMHLTFAPGSASTGVVELGVKLRTVAAQGVEYGNGGPKDLAGAGTPEGAVTAPVGSTFRRTDGGAGTCFYVKESGAGDTGWVAK